MLNNEREFIFYISFNLTDKEIKLLEKKIRSYNTITSFIIDSHHLVALSDDLKYNNPFNFEHFNENIIKKYIKKFNYVIGKTMDSIYCINEKNISSTIDIWIDKKMNGSMGYKNTDPLYVPIHEGTKIIKFAEINIQDIKLYEKNNYTYISPVKFFKKCFSDNKFIDS